MNINIDHYLNSWVNHRINCELQAKNKARLTNNHWKKIRKFHLEKYLLEMDSPFAFMFHLKYMDCKNSFFKSK